MLSAAVVTGALRVKEWTGMEFASSIMAAEKRTKWKGFVVKSSAVPFNDLARS